MPTLSYPLAFTGRLLDYYEFVNFLILIWGGMVSLFTIIDHILDLYSWAVILHALLGWLIHFGILNMRSRFVSVVQDFLYRITEPALRPLRRFIPSISGIDLSSIALLFILYFLRLLLREYGPL